MSALRRGLVLILILVVSAVAFLSFSKQLTATSWGVPEGRYLARIKQQADITKM